MYAFIASLAFLNKATLTKHRILRYESYSLIFRAVVSFFKNMSKNVSKIQATLYFSNSHIFFEKTCQRYPQDPQKSTRKRRKSATSRSRRALGTHPRPKSDGQRATGKKHPASGSSLVARGRVRFPGGPLSPQGQGPVY